MRTKALECIACPICKGPLDVKAITAQEGDHVMSGTLHCHSCLNAYPIIYGVPRLLPDNVRSQDVATGEAYSHYYAEIAPGGPRGDDTLYSKTVQQELDDFRVKTGVDDFRLLDGKAFLDAGCGLARIESALAEHCREILAFDVSPSVEQAFVAWRELPNVHIVQGDLTSAPLPPGHFDFVWCDGVLPYVSDLPAAVTELLASRSPTGFLYSWCYGPQIKLSHRLGRLFHATGLPIKIRFSLIYITCWSIRAAVTIKKRKNMLANVHRFAQGVLDASLANHINHVSEDHIRSLLNRGGLSKDVPVHIVTRGRNLDFRVGLI